jgi:hypothetical protein
LLIREYVKINLDFEEHGDGWKLHNPDDVIAKVSREYLEPPADD